MGSTTPSKRVMGASLPGIVTSDRLRTRLAGLDLPNPVGLAAGFDKNATALGPLGRAGFGFAGLTPGDCWCLCAARFLQALGAWGKAVTVMRATACAGGVVNGYRQPETLGVDRWCALVGARRRLGRAAVVVGAGTATTVDLLDGHGRFLGGLILPGLELMRESLARGTAGLARASGQVVRLPDNTADAIASGAVEATAGAVERASRRLGDAPCLLFGGAAAPLKSALTIEVIEEPLLVLEGLCVLAADSA